MSICIIFLTAQFILKGFDAPDCYSDGLAFYPPAGDLFVANLEQAGGGCSSIPYQIYRIDTINGNIQNSSGDLFPDYYHGLTFDGTYIWGAKNWTNIVKMSTNYAEISIYPDMGNFTFGLAYDPETNVLYVSQMQASGSEPVWVFKIDPSNFSKIDSFQLNQGGLPNYGWTDCAYDTINNVLWINNLVMDNIYAFNPSTGLLVDGFPSPRGQIEGLTFDGAYLWASETNLDSIYKIKIPEVSAEESFSPLNDKPLILIHNFPNLFKKEATLYFTLNTKGTVTFILLDATGKIVQRDMRKFERGHHKWKFKVNTPGNYFLKINFKNETHTFKVVNQGE